MNARPDAADLVDSRVAPGARVHAGAPADVRASESRSGPVSGSEPRHAHRSAAGAGLMALQRSAGNAAVASLLAGRPVVQRMDIQIDEMTSQVRAADSGATLSPAILAMVLKAIRAASAQAGVSTGEASSAGGTPTASGGAPGSPSTAETPPYPEEAP